MGRAYAAWAARWRVPLGFALGAAYLIFSQPIVRPLGIGGGVALVGLAIRAYAAGFLEKGRRLATGGPYVYTRNPLYLGSLLMGLGFAIAGGSWLLGVAFLALFLLIYWPVMVREEDFLRQKFGEIYGRYAESVPLFFPRWRAASASGEKFRFERYRKNREFDVALGYLAGIIFLILKFWLR